MSDITAFAEVTAGRNWERARKAARFEEIMSVLGLQDAELIPFDEVQKKLHLSQKNYLGVQEIKIDQIRGSVGRYQDFTQSFLPRKEGMGERWKRVNALAIDHGHRPIDVYKVGDAYFVVDGNHRVSVAKQLNYGTIEANVWEFPALVELSGEADVNELIVKEQYLVFLEKTGLDKLRPEQEIIFTVPGKYSILEWQIDFYKERLETIDEETLSDEDAVTAWYDMMYTPAIMIIQESKIMERFPDRTEADLYVWLQQNYMKLREHGQSAKLVDIVDQMDQPWWVRGIMGIKQRLFPAQKK